MKQFVCTLCAVWLYIREQLKMPLWTWGWAQQVFWGILPKVLPSKYHSVPKVCLTLRPDATVGLFHGEWLNGPVCWPAPGLPMMNGWTQGPCAGLERFPGLCSVTLVRNVKKIPSSGLIDDQWTWSLTSRLWLQSGSTMSRLLGWSIGLLKRAFIININIRQVVLCTCGMVDKLHVMTICYTCYGGNVLHLSVFLLLLLRLRFDVILLSIRNTFQICSAHRPRGSLAKENGRWKKKSTGQQNLFSKIQKNAAVK